MRVSFVIMTHNRRDVLAQTLGRLPELAAGDGLAPTDWEAVVVDNGSSDGTAAWLAQATAEPGSRVVALPLGENRGCGARNAGVAVARGAVVVFLDDDSWPRPGAVAAALGRLEQDPELGLLGGPVWLHGDHPAGAQDAAALPLVPPACGLVVRRAVFDAVAGFDAGFGYRAEEYELVFRVVSAGHGVARAAEVAFDHAKTPVARPSARIAQLDLRNNLVLLDRWLHGSLRDELRRDWIERYAALFRFAAPGVDVDATVAEAAAYQGDAPPAGVAVPLGAAALEMLFRCDAIEQGLSAWADEQGIRRVAVLGYAKTLWPVWRACERCGLEVVAVADDGLAFAAATYRGVAVRPRAEVAGLGFDGWVLANRNPAQAPRLAAAVADDGRPLWELDDR